MKLFIFYLQFIFIFSKFDRKQRNKNTDDSIMIQYLQLIEDCKQYVDDSSSSSSSQEDELISEARFYAQVPDEDIDDNQDEDDSDIGCGEVCETLEKLQDDNCFYRVLQKEPESENEDENIDEDSEFRKIKKYLKI